MENLSVRPLQLHCLVTESKLDVLIISSLPVLWKSVDFLWCNLTELCWSQRRHTKLQQPMVWNYSSCTGNLSDSWCFDYAKSMRLKFQLLIPPELHVLVRLLVLFMMADFVQTYLPMNESYVEVTMFFMSNFCQMKLVLHHNAVTVC